MNDIEHQTTLAITEFLDWDNETVREFTQKTIGTEQDPVQQAIKLFYTVRDKIRYDIYGVDMSQKGLKASSIIKNRAGFCIHKSIVFAAAARSLGIPNKLVFSDVKNHISTPALKSLVGGDVFHYHAYVEVFLNGKWVKATPVFNELLCRLFGIEPLEFDGIHDATLQPYDKQGNKSLEFIVYHGTFDDLPYTKCIAELKRHHPRLFLESGKTARGNLTKEIHLMNC
jgi:transglutaminase-like putative cysteine protease